MLNRRHFIVQAAALTAAASPAFAGLDPKDPDIKFGTTGSIFGVWPAAGTQNSISMKMSTNMPMMLADVKHYGLEGFEPYSAQVVQFLGDGRNILKKAALRGHVTDDGVARIGRDVTVGIELFMCITQGVVGR